MDVREAVVVLGEEPWEPGSGSEAVRVIGVNIETPFRNRTIRESWAGWPPEETTDGLSVQYWEVEGDDLMVYAVIEKGFSGSERFLVKAVFSSPEFCEMTLLVEDLKSLASGPAVYKEVIVLKGDNGPMRMTKQLEPIAWVEVFCSRL